MITLKTLPQATAREVFEQVRDHLLKQNERAEIYHPISTSVCVYRTEDGLKCAAGCLIGDDEYSEEMERKSWPKLVSFGAVPSEHAELIGELQNIHDTAEVTSWAHHLELLGNRIE